MSVKPAALALLIAHFCVGQSWPQLPCASPAEPAYPPLGAPPIVTVWSASRPCTGWTAGDDSTVVVTIARFRYPAGADGLRRRIGAISETAGMLYWSTTQQKWQKLIITAHALRGPDPDQARPDFSTAEIAPNATLYFEQQDNLFGNVTYRMHVRKATPSALEFAIENATTVRYWTVPVFQPGQVQSIYFLDKEPSGVWRYYAIARTTGKAGALLTGHESSLINRAAALYRWLAGIPGDLEPPAAR